jgi:hypothetical protein
MKKKEMSNEEHVQLLEAQLRKPDLAPKQAAAISRRISLLKGTERTYMGQGGMQSHARRKQEQAEFEKVPSSWKNEEQVRSALVSRIQGQAFSSVQNVALDECEKRWSAEVGLSIEDFREQVRREMAEYAAECQRKRAAGIYPYHPHTPEQQIAWDKASLAACEEYRSERALAHPSEP